MPVPPADRLAGDRALPAIGRSRFDRSCFPGLLEARADQFVLEFTWRELSELDLSREYGGDRQLGAGGVDVEGFYPECGFAWSPRYMCNQKIRALAAGAALVRQELAGRR